VVSGWPCPCLGQSQSLRRGAVNLKLCELDALEPSLSTFQQRGTRDTTTNWSQARIVTQPLQTLHFIYEYIIILLKKHSYMSLPAGDYLTLAISLWETFLVGLLNGGGTTWSLFTLELGQDSAFLADSMVYRMRRYSCVVSGTLRLQHVQPPFLLCDSGTYPMIAAATIHRSTLILGFL